VPLDRILEHPAAGFAWLLAILAAIALHEAAHAACATALGDTTAREQGRLTLNPLAHIDVLGFLLLVLVGFGWGRPVPYDPRAFRSPRWGSTAVALAGPGANIVAIIGIGFLLRAIAAYDLLPPNNLLFVFLLASVQIHAVLLVFNLIPIPPLDGSKPLLAAFEALRWDHVRAALETHGPLVLLAVVGGDALTNGAILAGPLAAAVHSVLRVLVTG
jgi:Zn-dependent protease